MGNTKTIFRTILIVTVLLLSVNASAQDSPLQFGVKAGMNLSNWGGDADGADAKIGFNIGVTLDYHFMPELALMTGLEYSLKGTKVDIGTKDNAKINLSYLQLPVHIGYKLPVADNTKIVFHAGPYLAYGVSGKYKIDGIDIDAFKDWEGEKFNKRFDFGIGLGIGAEFGKIGVGLGYDFGLVNIAGSAYGNASIKNQNGYLTIGYKF